MYKINDHGFIGYIPGIYKWKTIMDTEENFKKNILTHPELNYYVTNILTYSFNNYGHRCKNVEDVDLDNYILFVGCSYTEGMGLYLEDGFPYILSQKLNCDYYNLGLAGSGIDIQLHNLTTWLLKYNKPKLLRSEEHTSELQSH